jgi:hypothetical protein
MALWKMLTIAEGNLSLRRHFVASAVSMNMRRQYTAVQGRWLPGSRKRFD